MSIWAADRLDGWYDEMRSSLGTVYAGATRYTPGPDDLRLLNNPASGKGIVHEYAHLVSMQVNPTIPNNPRWLWEAIATYEAGQLDHPGGWTEAELTFPGLEALSQFESGLPHGWGFLISSAILDRWDIDGYLALIEANGRFEDTLGADEDEFGSLIEQYAWEYRSVGSASDQPSSSARLLAFTAR